MAPRANAIRGTRLCRDGYSGRGRLAYYRDGSVPDVLEVVWQDHAGRITSHLIDESDQPAVRATSGCRCGNSFIGVRRATPPLMAAVLPDSDGVLRAHWTP
jgi:hypothetical protein